MKKLTPGGLEAICDGYAKGVPVARLARDHGVSPQTIFEHLQRRGLWSARPRLSPEDRLARGHMTALAYYRTHRNESTARRRNLRSRDRDAHLARTAAYGARNRAIVDEAKNRPCADCGIQYPSYVMDLDHRPDESKAFTVGMTVHSASPARLLFEIAKCDVVCANCHRLRTHRRAVGQKSA